MRQESTPQIVVGDRFKEFLGNPGTTPASALLDRLRSGALAPTTPLALGQGLTAEQLRELGQLTGAEVPLPADRALTHKHEDKNVLIGEVRQTGPVSFAAPLLLDERVEVLEDHLTGQHIPAVTLLEAARQAWTAVAERFLLTEPEPSRFVIAAIRSQFHSFVFPLAATVEFRLDKRHTSPVGLTLDFLVTIRQDARTAAEFDVSLRVVPERVAAKQEAMAARQAIRAALSAAAP